MWDPERGVRRSAVGLSEIDGDEATATDQSFRIGSITKTFTATVRELLGMVSGFPEYTNDPAGPFGQVVLDPTQEFTAEDLVAFAATQEPTSTDEVTVVNANACCGVGIQNLFLATGAFPDDPAMARLNALFATLIGS